ncbi:transcriptional regulator [Aureimonas endophytica]|uniref:Transcriptional regulator n=1 Tax=Aureimonas endophytica TaxID=2027858 RepID=A0A916ZGY7_9HYPH|nr:LuxR C-terminal-related transcriptional regulator [Aureimonas endophytica]GGD95723.1 transcriptional regulator [Aureimonas endophytica]
MQGEQAAWVTLSPAEAGVTGLAAALAQSFGFALPGCEAALDPVLDTLAAIPARRLVLFLDEAGAAHGEALAALLAELPDKLRLVAATRGDLSLPLSRLRMRGLLAEIDAKDLAFTRGEMRRLLGMLSPAEFDGFAELVAGWPALVRLAAARLASDPGAEDRAAILAGLHRDQRAFLEEQVFAALPPDAFALLAAAAGLDEVPPALACRLAGLPEAGAVASFERLEPLTAPLPGRPGWFALQPLVRAALAFDGDTAEARRRHSLAAVWFAGSGQIEKAVRHAGEAGDFGFAAETIRAAGGVDLFLRAGYTVLRRLIHGIPPDVVHASPGLRLCAVLVLAKEGQIHAAREAIEELKALAAEGGSPEMPERVLVHIDSLIDIYEDCHFEAAQVEWLEARVRSYRVTDTWERGWLHNHLCIAHTREGHLRLARLHALKALDCYREEGAAYAQVFMLVHLALVNLLGGRLAAATTFGRQAEDLIQKTQWSDENLLAIARIPMAETLYRQGHVRAADAILAEALPVVARGEGWVDVFARGFVTYARCRRQLGGAQAALAVADRAEDVAEDRGLDRLRLVADILRVETLTGAGLLDAAAEAARRLPDPRREADWPTRRERRDAQVALARLRLRAGDPHGAARDLAAFADTGREEDDALTGLTAEILLAEALAGADDAPGALGHLIRAVETAQPQGLTEPFSAEGEPFRHMVRALVRRFGLTVLSPAASAFVNRIVASAGDGSPAPRPGMLSAREADVLALLAAGRSNKEIARELGITEATAKFHLKNLFAKLGASRRTMAVSVAKAMGLLVSA